MTSSARVNSIILQKNAGKNWSRVANAPLAKHKTTSHEGGVCTPMVVHWPKGISGKNIWNHSPSHLVDLVPTFAELTGA